VGSGVISAGKGVGEGSTVGGMGEDANGISVSVVVSGAGVGVEVVLQEIRAAQTASARVALITLFNFISTSSLIPGSD
jgi:hypothetical protein